MCHTVAEVTFVSSFIYANYAQIVTDFPLRSYQRVLDSLHSFGEDVEWLRNMDLALWTEIKYKE